MPPRAPEAHPQAAPPKPDVLADGPHPARKAEELTPAPLQPDKPIDIAGINGLNVDFGNNLVAADMKYVGKRVRGPWDAFALKMEKRMDGYWLILVIGQGGQIRTTGGGTIYPVYGVECLLSAQGAEQYAKQREEVGKMNMIGTVKGTRPYPANELGGKMVTLTDCSFIPKEEKGKSDREVLTPAQVEEKRRAEQEAERRRIEEEKAAKESLEAEAKRKAEQERIKAEDGKAQTLFSQALQLESRGFKKEARKRYQQIVEKYPDTPTAKRVKKLLEKH